MTSIDIDTTRAELLAEGLDAELLDAYLAEAVRDATAETEAVFEAVTLHRIIEQPSGTDPRRPSVTAVLIQRSQAIRRALSLGATFDTIADAMACTAADVRAMLSV